MWHTLSASFVLSGVAALLFMMAVTDSLRHRRLTLAAQVRLVVALIFGCVVAWLQWGMSPWGGWFQGSF